MVTDRFVFFLDRPPVRPATTSYPVPGLAAGYSVGKRISGVSPPANLSYLL
ncbi:hypothetical protein [Telmatospirillum sp.]|uniref:hypothetical protein n=1 Tax=Telmatospirillum sp. TaxID=2079197 RepID=UPI00284A5185|nr:hypothetical protein [Telmatospirillum sp.]MDR3436915.1 hypothetical protein [Telmatospirillum sp.]